MKNILVMLGIYSLDLLIDFMNKFINFMISFQKGFLRLLPFYPIKD